MIKSAKKIIAGSTAGGAQRNGTVEPFGDNSFRLFRSEICFRSDEAPGIVIGGQCVDADFFSAGRRMNKSAGADVNAHMRHFSLSVSVKKYQIAFLQVLLRNWISRVILRS